ncbi:hypothetical protein KPL76_06740 [Subtercola sp. PAMC28395]|uniref:hypothetical protein n=1 Tax=Subtercola sp. PAMC28395 TaxID=2846775 RepID=UPI001C0D5252|nr:hypothetical protein [Subtercola sp. PAMC28395]QWT25037.1 hypothetical protein KPL76_06740 [Subtercola sp. PAMC28395]
MPQDSAHESNTSDGDRVTSLEKQRDDLQAELDAIANRVVGRWLTAEHFDASALAAMKQTLSWRVTTPLRAVRSLQIKRNDSPSRSS